MADEPVRRRADEVPDGAAVFPEIPAELGVHPLLLAVLHAFVFLDGSDDGVVNPAAADEAMEYLADVPAAARRAGPAAGAARTWTPWSATRRSRSGRKQYVALPEVVPGGQRRRW